jgi:hypothetical protein
MRPEFPLIMLTAFILVSAHLAHAQRPKKIPRIGFLLATFASVQESRLEADRIG